MKKIKIIFFDVGGVLIKDFSSSNKFEKMLSEFELNNLDIKIFLDLFDEYDDKICKGKISCDQFMKIANTKISFKFSEDFDLCQEFVNRFELNIGIHDVVSKISKKYKVGLLTNMYIDMLNKIITNKLLPDISFDFVVDSSVVGLQKPDIEIFKFSESLVNVKSDEILFIDNTKKHLEAAMEKGWKTYFFDSSDYKNSSLSLSKYLDTI